MSLEASLQKLKHPNPNMRSRAIAEIVDIRDENTIPTLIGFLGEANTDFRRAVVKTLGVIGPDSVPSLVKKLHASDDTTVKASCTKAMAQVAVNHPDKPFPAVGSEALKAALSDADPVVHITAAMALGAVGAAAKNILLDGLTATDNPAAAIAIVNALSSIQDEGLIDVLNEVAHDESVDSYVRETATSAVSRLEMMLGR
ncbi:HEAT repeat domain-containing protein [Synechococcus sp. PCC 7336]|uniref:HEAT repeat domain-containing protein n=1 Tax=Synechococcus sp. PCC 7336 TaxID=195250 RepID=UPI00034B4E70|nr:HEAT repeat domain-containing protein [Synechococcus sp. PCC 7336]